MGRLCAACAGHAAATTCASHAASTTGAASASLLNGERGALVYRVERDGDGLALTGEPIAEIAIGYREWFLAECPRPHLGCAIATLVIG